MGKPIFSRVNTLNAKSKLHHSTNQDVITVIWIGWFKREKNLGWKHHRMRYTSAKWIWIQAQCIFSTYQFVVRTSASPFHASFSFWRMNVFCESPPPNAAMPCKSHCFIVYNHWLATAGFKGWSHSHFVKDFIWAVRVHKTHFVICTRTYPNRF